MKSLKNKKCIKCSKPAEVWLPNEDDDEEPYCLKCATNLTILDTIDIEDDDED